MSSKESTNSKSKFVEVLYDGASTVVQTVTSISFWIKLLVVYIAVYIGLAVGLAVFTPYTYEYYKFNWLNYSGSILTQPTMEVFGNGKISRWYDWSNIKYSDIDKTIQTAEVRSKSSTIVDYDKTFSLNNLKVSLGGINNAVIVKPASYKGKWRPIFCTEDKNTCKVSNIYIENRIKMLVDGNSSLWGMSDSGKIIQLQVEKYITAEEYLELILI